MSKKIDFLKQKLNDDKYNNILTKLIYSYIFNPKINPVSFDKLEVYAYGLIARSTKGVIREPICNNYGNGIDDYQFLVLKDIENDIFYGAVIPPFNTNNSFWSYLFNNGDYWFFDFKDCDIIEDSYLLTNSSKDQIIINMYDFDKQDTTYEINAIMDDMFIEFSKFCLSYRKVNKVPPISEIINLFNKR